MTCSRNKVTHSATSVARVKDPPKRFRKIITIIYNTRNVNQLDNILFSPVLDSKVRCFDMSSAFRRVTCIDNIDAGFVVFIDESRTSRWLVEAGENVVNEETHLGSRNSSIKLSFSRTKSSSGLSFGPPSDGTTSKHNRISSSGPAFA